MANQKFSRKSVYFLLKTVPNGDRRQVLYDHILDTLKIDSRPLREDVEKEFLQNLSTAIRDINKRWTECNRHEERFLEGSWSDTFIKLPSKLYTEKENLTANNVGGRPRTENFEALSDSSKRRRTADLRTKFSAPELGFACQMKLREIGKKEDANVVLGASSTSKSNSPKCECVLPTKLSDEEAVALLDSCHMTKANYLLLRKVLIAHNADILPNYHLLVKGKEKCYPTDSDMIVTNSEATLSVQAVFDHTAKRLIEAQKEVHESRPTVTEFNLIWKWGFDGSSGHAERKQTIDEPIQESNIILTAAVPLQLYSKSEDGWNLIFWHNKRPSSTRLCRPLQLLHEKESKMFVKEHTAAFKNQMSNLQPCRVDLSNEIALTVTHKPFLSMIDGKIKSYISDTAAQTCSICLTTPKDMNKIDMIKSKPIKLCSLENGISILHGWIRFLELCWHVTERLTVEASYRPLTPEETAKKNEQSKTIKQKLRDEMGLLVDQPRSIGGSGSTNDGNTARRFFDDPVKTAAVTGLNADFLERVRIIMIVLSSGFAISVSAFREYGYETAHLFATEYYWYYMSNSVHNILMHGAEHIQTASIPIGLFSEEPLESRHKDLRYYRKHHIRLADRAMGFTDLIQALLVSSDPVINLYKPVPKRKHLVFPTAALRLLSQTNCSEALIDVFEEDEFDEDM